MPDADPVAAPTEDEGAVRPWWGLGDAAAGWVLAQVGAAIAAGLIVAGTGQEFDDLSIAWVAVAQVGLWAGMLGIPWFAARVKGNGLVRDFGLRVTRGDLTLGLVVGMVAQFAMVLVYLPIFWLFDKDAEDLSQPARDMADRAQGAFGVVLLVIVVGIGAPIVEEVFYRGLVQRSVARRFGPWPGAIVTGVLFGAVHFQPLQFLSLALFGVILGALVLRTGRLGASIVAHMAFNLTAVASLVTT